MDLRLAKKGRSVPRAALVQQGNVQIKLAHDHEAELVVSGWPATKTGALEADVAALGSAAAVHADNQEGARHASHGEQHAIDEAKRFVRALRNALPMALRNGPPDVAASAFHMGEPLQRITPRIAKYLNDITPAVEKLDAALAPFFGKAFPAQKPSEALAAVKGALASADATQETALSSLPQETLGVYEKKGRVLEAIEDLNRVAKIAFDGDAATIAKFNKDLLLRGRKAQKKAPADPAPEAPKAPAVEPV